MWKKLATKSNTQPRAEDLLQNQATGKCSGSFPVAVCFRTIQMAVPFQKFRNITKVTASLIKPVEM
jgi:hypothetical protein